MGFKIEDGALAWEPDKDAKSPTEIEHPLSVTGVDEDKKPTKKAASHK